MYRIIILLVVLVYSGCTQTMYQPIGLGLTSDFCDQSVMSAIKQGAKEADWKILSQEERSVIARYESGDKYADVEIIHDREVISFIYKSSSGFDYEMSENTPKISLTYNQNLESLEESIALQLAEILIQQQ